MLLASLRHPSCSRYGPSLSVRVPFRLSFRAGKLFALYPTDDGLVRDMTPPFRAGKLFALYPTHDGVGAHVAVVADAVHK